MHARVFSPDTQAWEQQEWNKKEIDEEGKKRGARIERNKDTKKKPCLPITT